MFVLINRSPYYPSYLLAHEEKNKNHFPRTLYRVSRELLPTKYSESVTVTDKVLKKAWDNKYYYTTLFVCC